MHRAVCAVLFHASFYLIIVNLGLFNRQTCIAGRREIAIELLRSVFISKIEFQGRWLMIQNEAFIEHVIAACHASV